jgi:hypothetical protein
VVYFTGKYMIGNTMANLTIVKDGQTYLVTDAGTGEVVISTTDPTLANTFAAAGDSSSQAIATANAQTINYQGGIDTQATSPQLQNEYGDLYTPIDPVPASSVQTSSGTQLQNEYGDYYTPLPAQNTIAQLQAGTITEEQAQQILKFGGTVPASEINTNSATSGLTPAQLSSLGGADPTDPFIRARLDLPPLGVSQPTLVDAVSNISFPSLSSIQTSIGNTFASVGEFFTPTSSTVSASSVQATPTGPQFQNEYGDFYTPIDPVPASSVQTAATSPQLQNEYGDFYTPIDPVPVSSVQTTPTDPLSDAYYEQFVQSFSEADVQTGPAFAPTAALDETPLVSVSEIDNSPTDVNPNVDGGVQELPSEVSSGFYDNTPVVVDTPVEDPVPLSEIDNSPADINPDIDAEAQAPVEDPVPLSELDQVPVAPYDDSEAANAQLNQDLANAAESNPDLVEIPAPVDPEEDPVAANDGFVETDPGFYTFADDIPEGEAEEQELVPIPEPNVSVSDVNTEPAPLSAENVQQNLDQFNVATAGTNPADTAAGAAAITQGFVEQARQQQTIANQRRQINNGDWRVRLRLAPSANYLYKAANPGIMQPLSITDGVLFPYLPSIDTVYKADYDPYTLTHSNYKGYFYKGSSVEAVSLRCPFTAQSSGEANYLLAVITFFKSVTKMFYGQDAQRGSPPPLVFLSGLGEYQFNEHPCVVSQFNLNLPTDVDYIRAGSPNNVGINATNQRARQDVSIPGGGNLGRWAQLLAQGISKGAINNPPAPPTLGLNSPTYVPTKMEISITLLPIQSRQQVSKQFSVKEFANGNLIKGGFW